MLRQRERKKILFLTRNNKKEKKEENGHGNMIREEMEEEMSAQLISLGRSVGLRLGRRG